MSKMTHYSGYSSNTIGSLKEHYFPHSDATPNNTYSFVYLLRIMPLFCLLLSLFTVVKADTINNNTILEISSAQYTRRLTYGTNQLFTYAASGQPFTFIVPSGVTSIYVEATGAASGIGNGGTQGLGAKVTSTLSVIPGTTLYIYIGGKGTNGLNSGGINGVNAGGFNGGGSGYQGAGGGGATDIRNGTGTMNNRLLVAAGGGGPDISCSPTNGGNGGSPIGVTGGSGSCGGSARGGGGGTQSTGGINSNCASCAGILGEGGDSFSNNNGGGGGGGYYGGAAGYFRSGGGGGSSYSIGSSTTYPTPLTNTGDGSLAVFYDIPPAPSPTSQPSKQPSQDPSGQPSRQPTRQPSYQPVTKPSSQPSVQPTARPSSVYQKFDIMQHFTFAALGQPFTFIVPYGVTSIYVEASGEASGTANGGTQGLGTKVTSIFSVIPGTTLYIYIGGRGTNGLSSTVRAGGFNGGGSGSWGAGGGGATDIRNGTGTVNDRLLVAAGGGGPDNICNPSNGGNGGGPNGVDGDPGSCIGSGANSGDYGAGGGGATQSTGGTNSNVNCGVGCEGTFGQGGNGGGPQAYSGGGGGGGYFGGGGGYWGGAGGGGSSYSIGSGTTYPTPLTNTGDGSLTIFYDPQPTPSPTLAPSRQPSGQPSQQPTSQPSFQPSCLPTSQPSTAPSNRPTTEPSIAPSDQPSMQPVALPSVQPSGQPIGQPLLHPSAHPSCQPIVCPSVIPSIQPSGSPSWRPASRPSRQPSGQPSQQPVGNPTDQPSFSPSAQPVADPSAQPSGMPSLRPSRQPTQAPSTQSSSQPSEIPSVEPSQTPSSQPSLRPSMASAYPSSQPSKQPTRQPNSRPTLLPSPYSFASELTRLPTMTFVERISVVYKGGNVTDFKIVLPFMFTNPVYGNGKFDVIVLEMNVARSLLVVFGLDSHTSSVGYDLLEMSPAISYDYSGRSLSNAGDVNGDGYDDLIIGVPYAFRCHVMFGTSQGFVHMTEGFTVYGTDSSDLTGWSVSGAGDVNNDTFADIIIGAPSAGIAQSGAVYVLYGKEIHRNVYLSQLSEEDGFVVYGATEQDSLGIAVSGTGDVNDDGFDDIAIGALRMNNFFSGGVYILFGNRDRSDNVFILKELLMSVGFFIEGPPWSWFGYSLGRAGDVNGDGVDDILIGSVPRKVFLGIPISYIIFGKHNGTFVSGVEKLTITQGVKIIGGGVAVNGVGDVNEDGFDDILLVGGVDFSSGGGIVVQIPSWFPQLTALPSYSPFTLPSIAPSKTPTVAPTLIPTRPTTVPTVAPTGPTFSPSMVPTQPTSVPSARPTAPTLAPSVCPTPTPSTVPSISPSVEPSMIPSKSPSLQPTTTFSPTTKTPSGSPTVIVTRLPTRYPAMRPSMMPSNYSEPPVANITYNVIHVKRSGQYTHVGNNTHYIVNCTSDVMIFGGGGILMFTVIPNRNTTLQITHFNVSTDVIDLKAFRDIYSMNQLFRGFDKRLLVLTTVYVSVEISLGSDQSILIANISQFDLEEDNFIFAREQSIPAIGRLKRSYGPLIVFCIVCGLIGLFVMFQAGEQLKEYFHTQRLMARVSDWDSKNVRDNPTYLSFNNDELDESLSSDSDKESEDDSSDVTSDSKESTVYESPRHSVIGSKSDSDSLINDSIKSNLKHTNTIIKVSDSKTPPELAEFHSRDRSQNDEEAMIAQNQNQFTGFIFDEKFGTSNYFGQFDKQFTEYFERQQDNKDLQYDNYNSSCTNNETSFCDATQTKQYQDQRRNSYEQQEYTEHRYDEEWGGGYRHNE